MLKYANNQIHLYCIIIGVIFFYTSCRQDINQNNNTHSALNDSVSSYIYSYKQLPLHLKKQKQYLLKAKQLNDSIKNNIVRKNNYLEIASEAYKSEKYLFFRKINSEAYELASQLNDTLGIAETYWNLGSFFRKKEQLDSSYFHYSRAYHYYNAINNEEFSARMLYNMAFIQSRYKDYTNSETKLFIAINKNKELNEHLSLYRCYALLGIIYTKRQNFESSLEYYNKAFEALENVEDKRTHYERNLNNIGVLYKKQKDYENSILYFNKALKSIDPRDRELYAALKDNLAYSKFLQGKTKSIKKDFVEALKIREQINDISGISVNKLHIAEYYLKLKDTVNALTYAKGAYSIVTGTKNNDDILSSLLLLSKIDKSNSIQHLERHIELTKSIQDYEAQQINKFARIRFETDEYKAANEKLTGTQSLIIAIAVGSFSVLSLLFFIKIQNARNKALKLEKNQRKINEEIYKLMLKQQSKLEEGRINERHRISEELHDGILGKIFGTRMGLAFLDIKGDDATKKQYKKFIDELQNIEKEMRTISHDLKNELLTSKTDFISIIEGYLTDQNSITDVNFSINRDSDLNWNFISDEIRINIYRIIQEAIQNSIKHANAKAVKIKLKKVNESIISLQIEDNGKGFNKAKLKNIGIGLSNMQSRIESLNGDFKIKSKVNSGTKIEITIPFNYEY